MILLLAWYNIAKKGNVITLNFNFQLIYFEYPSILFCLYVCNLISKFFSYHLMSQKLILWQTFGVSFQSTFKKKFEESSEIKRLTHILTNLNIFIIFKHFIYLFLERGKGGREKERNIDMQEIHRSVASHTPPTGTQPTTQACAPTGNWTCNLPVRRPALNPLRHTSQATNLNLRLKKQHCEC